MTRMEKPVPRKEVPYERLLEAARTAMDSSYCPYSKAPAGAALFTDSGEIVTGCKIEIASFSGSSCAEATALLKAITMGFRDFLALALIPGGWPCGQCRQMFAEFGLDMEVIVESTGGAVDRVRISELLPVSFGPENLQKPLQ